LNKSLILLNEDLRRRIQLNKATLQNYFKKSSYVVHTLESRRNGRI